MRVSGRALVYRDRNFLLPTAPPILDRPVTVDPDASANAASRAASAAAASAASTTPAPDGSAGTKSGEPSIEQIVADLDKAVGTTGGRKGAPDAMVAPAPSEGAAGGSGGGATESADSGATSGFLTARRARIVRSGDGSPMAVVDSGTGGRTEGPMLLMPCQNLSAIETITDTAGEGTTFTLTGEVHVYKGRRYLLPTMYTVNRASDNVLPAH
jgi:hypothetical protein